MKAYKLLKKRKDGTLGSLFVDARTKLEVGKWYPAVDHEPKTLKHRPFWHSLTTPDAPHLSPKGRVWCEVEVEDYHFMDRPACQGGRWILSNRLRIVKEL